jgi:transposase
VVTLIDNRSFQNDIDHTARFSLKAFGGVVRELDQRIRVSDPYADGVFTVERHILGKWACEQCEMLTQAPVPAHVIDKGIPTAGLLAHFMVAKFC